MVLENKTGHVVTVVNSFTQTEIPIDEKAEIDVSDGGALYLTFFSKKERTTKSKVEVEDPITKKASLTEAHYSSETEIPLWTVLKPCGKDSLVLKKGSFAFWHLFFIWKTIRLSYALPQGEACEYCFKSEADKKYLLRTLRFRTILTSPLSFLLPLIFIDLLFQGMEIGEILFAVFLLLSTFFPSIHELISRKKMRKWAIKEHHRQ